MKMSPGIAVDVSKAPPLLEGSPRNSSLDFQKPPELVGFPGGTEVKSTPANGGDSGNMDSIPGSGRFPGRGNGNPLQYSSLDSPIDKGIHGGLKELDRTE